MYYTFDPNCYLVPIIDIQLRYCCWWFRIQSINVIFLVNLKGQDIALMSKCTKKLFIIQNLLSIKHIAHAKHILPPNNKHNGKIDNT